MTLFELGAHAEELLNALNAETDEPLTEDQQREIIDSYLSAEGALDAKVDGYAALIREFEARAVARDNEAARLAKLAEADRANARRLTDRLKWFMETTNRLRIETTRFRIGVVRNGGKVPVVYADVRAEDLDEEWTRVRREIDRERVREALEEGAELSFAKLGQRGTRLQVR